MGFVEDYRPFFGSGMLEITVPVVAGEPFDLGVGALTQVRVVPVPPALALLATALFGLGAFGRRAGRSGSRGSPSIAYTSEQ